MSKEDQEVHCNGGFLDAFDLINSELEKHDKKKIVIGFERDKKNPNHLRFFDKNNSTVWLPDEFYKRVNIAVIKMGGLKIGRRESNKWKQIATGHYTDISLKIEMKIKEVKKQVKETVGRLLKLNQR